MEINTLLFRPSVNSSTGMRLLPLVLSLIAGSVDVISFLGLNGLFVSHITGNLVILAAHIVGQGNAPIALMLSVPMFIIILGVTKVLVYVLEKYQQPSLVPLLSLQMIFLCGFFIFGVSSDIHQDPNAIKVIAAGMFGVAAMAVQNALVQLSLSDAPATAVMTTNITHFVMDVGEMLLGQDNSSRSKARKREKYAWPALVGFALGCALGALCEATFGLWSLILPLLLALLALTISLPRSIRIQN